MNPQNTSSEKFKLLDLQKIIVDENNSDKRPSDGDEGFAEFKRVSLQSICGTDGNIRVKPHSAVLNKNKSSTSRADTHFLAPIFSGEEEQHSHLSSVIQIRDQDESEAY